MEYLHNLLGHLPPWAYVAIIGGGIAAAFILPKFFGGTGNQTTPSNGNDTAAIDPNSGLPYPTSGYPGGAFAGGAGFPVNDGQQATSADYQALLAELKTIADRLESAPTTPPPTTSKPPTSTTPPVIAPGPSGGVHPPTSSTHVTAQPSPTAIAAGKAKAVAQNKAQSARRVAAADARLGG